MTSSPSRRATLAVVCPRKEPPFGAPREHSALPSWRVQNNPFWIMSIGATKVTVYRPAANAL